jgi:hypothetical protein
VPGITEPEGWRPAAAGRIPAEDWAAPGEPEDADYHTGTARTVEFRREDQPGSAVLVYVYPAWRGDQPLCYSVHITFELVCGQDPRNLAGTRTWQAVGGGEAPTPYRSERAADDAARYIAGLLTQAAWHDLSRVDPALYTVPLAWDGIPYQLTAVA